MNDNNNNKQIQTQNVHKTNNCVYTQCEHFGRVFHFVLKLLSTCVCILYTVSCVCIFFTIIHSRIYVQNAKCV